MSIINICINNVNREYYLEEGSSGIVLENIVKDIESEYKGYITLANINNKFIELQVFFNKNVFYLCLATLSQANVFILNLLSKLILKK